MSEYPELRMTKIPLNHGGGSIPALGFGTLIPDPAVTVTATKDALEAGFRHFDCAERYRNEREVGEALQAGLAAGGISRQDVFITTKLWNTNHRPERVAPAFEASLDRLRIDYLDLYLIHTPFAFQPGDEQDPRDQRGNVLYCSTRRNDAGTGAVGLGSAAWDGTAHDAEDCRSSERKFQYLAPSKRRIRRNQSHSDETKAQ
jgi:aldehyde reductase